MKNPYRGRKSSEVFFNLALDRCFDRIWENDTWQEIKRDFFL